MWSTGMCECLEPMQGNVSTLPPFGLPAISPTAGRSASHFALASKRLLDSDSPGGDVAGRGARRSATNRQRTGRRMRQTWRWFGPVDKVSLADARQAGVEGIVTALHHVPTGAVWTPEEIEKRQREVAFHPGGGMTHLAWEVVESLPVSEAIKTQSGEWRAHIVHYRRSLENLARAGINVDLLQFHAGARLDAHRIDLAGRAWRARHALRPC